MPDRNRLQPLQRHIRFTEEQVKRLNRVARSRGETTQSFALRAIMAAVAEAEADLRADAELKRRARKNEDFDFSADLPNEPKGLGIREGLERERERKEAATIAALPASPTVVINNGPGASSAATDATVAKLAAHVANAPRWQRDAKRRSAVEALQMLADSNEERQALARRLDELVADLDHKAGRAPALNFTFDQIKDLLGRR